MKHKTFYLLNAVLTLLLCLHISSCEETLVVEQEILDNEGLVQLINEEDTTLDIYFPPYDPQFPKDPPGPMRPIDDPVEGGFDFFSQGDMYLSLVDNIATGTYDTGFGDLSDGKIVNLNDPLRDFNYSCNDGVISIEANRSFFYRPEDAPDDYIWLDPFPNGYTLNFRDKNPLIYHQGGSWIATYRTYTIKIHFITTY